MGWREEGWREEGWREVGVEGECRGGGRVVMQFLVYKHVLSPRLIDLFHKMEQVWERGLCSQLPITHSQVVQEYRPIQVGREVLGHPGNMRQVHTVQVQTKKVRDHRSDIPCLLLVHSLHQPQTHRLLPGWERTLSGSSASHFAH